MGPLVADPVILPSDLASYQAGDPDTLIEQATAVVRSYCRWHVTPVIDQTWTFDGDCTDLLLLPSLRIASVASVTVDGVVQTSDTYSVRERGSLRRIGDVWTGTIVVVASHGFDLAPDLASIVAAVATRAQASPDGVTRRQTGAVSESYSLTGPNAAGGVSLLESEKIALDPYRLPPRP